MLFNLSVSKVLSDGICISVLGFRVFLSISFYTWAFFVCFFSLHGSLWVNFWNIIRIFMSIYLYLYLWPAGSCSGQSTHFSLTFYIFICWTLLHYPFFMSLSFFFLPVYLFLSNWKIFSFLFLNQSKDILVNCLSLRNKQSNKHPTNSLLLSWETM